MDANAEQQLQPTPGATSPVLQVEGLRKVYSGRPVVESVSLTVGPGEIIGLLGPNGAGKSTTFKMLCGLLQPSEGSARVVGLDLQKALADYLWPGNVRELENACKRVAVLKPDGEISLADFALTGSTSVTSAVPNSAEPSRQALEFAIEKHEGVIARVAKEFGMSRQSLYRRLKKFGIEY